MKKSIKILSLLLIITVILFSIVCFSGKDNSLKVYFFDVGQGDAILIRTPSHQNIVIDGGPDNSFITKVGQTLPFYDRTIDLMILTHPHDDHIYGLIEILKRYQVKQILSAEVICETEVCREWDKIIQIKQIPVKTALVGQTFVFDQTSLQVLYPLENLSNRRIDNLNNSSVVTQLIYNKIKLLFMGDLEQEGEIKIIQSAIFDLKADILKLGHHGSDTSTSQEFLNLVNPDYAVIQVGADNKFGHPSKRIIKRLERMAINILRTDTLGDIIMVSDGQKIWLK